LVNLPGSFSRLAGGSALTVADGATVAGGQFYTIAPEDRLSILNGSVSGTLVDSTGLLQLGDEGSLSGTGNIYIRSGGRFEAAGDGLATTFAARADTGGTVAVGITDPVTGDRASAQSFTLNSPLQMSGGSHIEFGIFGPDSGDEIVLGESAWFRNTGSGAILDLVTHGYTPVAGDSYMLFSGSTDTGSSGSSRYHLGITGPFDTSNIDPNQWDLSHFNQAGGWVVTAIPEPASVALLGLGGLLLMRRRRET
jgi:hypothetical protein